MLNQFARNIVVSVGLASAVILVIAAQSGTQAQDRDNPQAIEGLYHLGTEDCGDGKSDPCKFYVELRGATAKALYDNMRSKAQKDECGGGTMKTDDDVLYCFASDPDDYVCWFGYDFEERKITVGDFSC